MNSIRISIAEQYSEAPTGRNLRDGPFSGERFRDEILFPALNTHDKVEIELDGTLGYGSSFLEEAFGGLIREREMTLAQINNKLVVHSSRKLYLERITKYLSDAEKLKTRK